MSDEAVYPGLWECGACGEITTMAHYVTDRMTGEIRHHNTVEGREGIRSRCGWSSTYSGYHIPPVRCSLRHGHHGSHDPQTPGFGHFTEQHPSAIPPYDPASANQKPPAADRCRYPMGHRYKHACSCTCALPTGHKGRHACEVTDG